jgi:hypothetical protein
MPPDDSSSTPIVDLASVAEPAAAKRGRGRPRKSPGDSAGGSSTAARTGNKSSRAEKEKASVALDVGTISFAVNMFGSFIAARSKQPKLELDEEESGKIAERVAHVGSFYNVPVSPVSQAWIGLAGCIGAIYWGKIAALKIERAMEAESRRAT